MKELWGPRGRPAAESADEPPSVLIADDDDQTLYSLREALGGLEVQLFCASSGRQVLKHLLQRDFSVVLLDVRMPDIDGYETAALIRKRERSSHIPLIFMTAQDRDFTQVFRGYSAGAVDYVFKPVDPFILRSKVSVFLDLYSQGARIRRLLHENILTRTANEEYVERLQRLSRELMTLQDAERRYLARELHDEIGQCMTALNLNLQRLRQEVAPREAGCELVDDSLEIVRTLTRQVRDISLDLHPTMLEDLGLETAVGWYVEHMRERSGLAIDCRCELNGARLSADQSTACYRIMQSAFANVMRHAQATRVSIELHQAGGELELVVADNGVGFDKQRVYRMIQQGKSFGLIALRERSALVGGSIDIDTRPGDGTRVRLRVPLNGAAVRRLPESAPAQRPAITL